MNNYDQRILVTIVGALLAVLIKKDDDPVLDQMNEELKEVYARLGGETGPGDKEADDDTS